MEAQKRKRKTMETRRGREGGGGGGGRGEKRKIGKEGEDGDGNTKKEKEEGEGGGAKEENKINALGERELYGNGWSETREWGPWGHEFGIKETRKSLTEREGKLQLKHVLVVVMGEAMFLI